MAGEAIVLNPEDNVAVALRDMEAAFLVNALKRNQWHRAQTARELGIHKSTLFRRIKSLGISIPPGL